MTALTVTDAGNMIRELNARYQPKGVCAATPAKMRVLLDRLQAYTDEVQRARNKYKALGVASIALGPAGVAVGQLLGGGDVDVAQWRSDMATWQLRLAAYQRVLDTIPESEWDTAAGCREIYPLVTAPLLDGIYYDVMPGIVLSSEEKERIQDGTRHCPEGVEKCVDIAYRDPVTGDHPPGHSNPKVPDAITPFSLGNQIIVYQDFQKENLRRLIDDLKKAVQPDEWPWWLKASIIAGAGIGVGMIGLYVAQFFPDAPKKNPRKRRASKTSNPRSALPPDEHIVEDGLHYELPEEDNPYLGDAVALAKYRKEHEQWIHEGRKGPPPIRPGTTRKKRATKSKNPKSRRRNQRPSVMSEIL